MQLEIYKKDGSLSGEKINLPAEIFEIAPNEHVIYQAVRAYRANQRQGTHKTKTYGEVSGSGKKLWRQKHTGRARIGAVRSPLWKGGGTIFGPVPRDYTIKMPKQLKQLARKSVLSAKAKESAIKIIEDFSFEKPATKEMVTILKALKIAEKKTLLLVSAKDVQVYKSGRNIEKLNVVEAAKASAYELLDNQVLLIQKSAVSVIEKTLNS
jgi:large subunit ribosomal protein L4